jgi:molybdopterin/thiamine biosynthesis adenylyltransferase
VRFSDIDWANDREKFHYVAHKIPGICHATAVVGRESLDAHMWEQEKQDIVPIDRVQVIDSPMRFLVPTSAANRGTRPTLRRRLRDRFTRPSPDRWLDRQVRALGREAQRLIETLHVAVVGCGGTGSIVAELLARSGVRRLTLIDPDTVEASNLNRLLGAYRRDALLRRSKVAVLKRQAQLVNPRIRVTALRSSVCTQKALKLLKEADIIFGCTDNQGSRLVLNRVATQYYIPYIDCGSGLSPKAEEAHLDEAGGQIRTVLPGSFCLECVGGIDRETARDELMTESQRRQRRAHGYGAGPEEPAPQVMALNMSVAAQAVGEFIKLVTGMGPCHRYVLYDWLGATMSPLKASRNNACVVCGEGSAAALGDREPLWEVLAGEGAEDAPPSAGLCTEHPMGGR